MTPADLTLAAVLVGVAFDEARTTAEVAHQVCGEEGWRHRTNVLNRLYELEAMGLVISDDERPVHWLRPDLDVSSTD